jgi:AcrR family transcriptional regulator
MTKTTAKPAREPLAKTPPSNRQPRISSAERRDKILLAARGVFIRSGFSGARTKEIAIQAQINEALLYRHFASKDELFDAAVMEPLEHWMAAYDHVGPTIAMEPSAENRLRLLQKTSTRYLQEMYDMLPLLGIALFGQQAHAEAFYTLRIVPMLDMWTELSQRSMPQHARGRTLDPGFLAKAGFGIVFAVSADARFRNIPFDPVELGRQLAKLYLPLYDTLDPSQERPGE